MAKGTQTVFRVVLCLFRFVHKAKGDAKYVKVKNKTAK